jgi:glycosyltransferase involved in cell wall biosynthesis
MGRGTQALSVRRRRAVVLVGGPARPYSRALRIARTLAGEGYDVEIAAISVSGAPEVEQEGPVTVRRYVPSGPFARFAAHHIALDAGLSASGGDVPARAPAKQSRALPGRDVGTLRSWAQRVVRYLRKRRRWALWPETTRGWWATLDRELAPADLYHACGGLTVAAALAAARKDRRSGRRPVVIFDAVDNTFEGNSMIGIPRLLLRFHLGRERRWAREADARTTVNEALAMRLAARWGVEPPIVIPNWPEPPAPGVAEGSDRIREALGLPPEIRIVLFQGRLSPNLGLDEAAEAVLRVDGACLVLLGFGVWQARCRARDRDPRFAGRHFTLPAVHPDELPWWTASADVSLLTLPPVSLNQRESTPNKFWESLLVGTPVVVGPDLDVMARIVDEARAGIVAASLEPVALAEAIRTVLDGDPPERAERRRQLSELAADRYTWPRAADRYRELLSRTAEWAPRGPR